VTERALSTKIHLPSAGGVADDDDEDEFKDAVSTEEERKQSVLNEFELAIAIQDYNTQITLDCTLSDMRFVFAVPTA